VANISLVLWRRQVNYLKFSLFPHFFSGLKTIAVFTRNYWHKHKYFRLAIGVICILWGIIALVTPFTPGAWLIFVGLEIFGYKILFWEKTKLWLKKHTRYYWNNKKQIRPNIIFGIIYLYKKSILTILWIYSDTILALWRKCFARV
jgi:hypothetical protein